MNTNRSITFDYKGVETGHRYHGKFTIKTSITKRESFTADEFRRTALGSNSRDAPSQLQTDAYIAGQLFVFITDAPKWWKESDSGMELPTEDQVSYALYDAILAEIAAFKAEKAAEAEELVKTLD